MTVEVFQNGDNILTLEGVLDYTTTTLHSEDSYWEFNLADRDVELYAGEHTTVVFRYQEYDQ